MIQYTSIIGAHDHHDGLTHYRLDRVLNLTMIDEPVIEATEKIGLNPELQIRKYVDESVNHFSGETIRIEVEYEPEQVANAILYDFVGDNITVTEQPNGKCRSSFRKMNSETLVAWFMQHSGRFKVVGPEKLKADVVAGLRKALAMYE